MDSASQSKNVPIPRDRLWKAPSVGRGQSNTGIGAEPGRSASDRCKGHWNSRPRLGQQESPTMPHDRDEKPGPAAKVAPRFDFDDLPRVRPNFFLTPDDPPAKPAPRKPAPTPPPEAAPAFDFGALPRVRPNFFLTPDDPPGKPTPQKPATGPARETSLEFDPDNVLRVRPQFRITTDKPWAKPTLQKPAPASAARKMPGGTGGRAHSPSARTNPHPGSKSPPARAGPHYAHSSTPPRPNRSSMPRWPKTIKIDLTNPKDPSIRARWPYMAEPPLVAGAHIDGGSPPGV